MAIAFEVVIVLLLLILNGVFAMSEMAVVSARKARLQQLAEQGDMSARAALALSESPNRFLSTVQIGITLVGILAGAFGGATIAEQLAERLAVVPALAPYAETIGVAVVVLAITYLSLVIGELVPKRLALQNPERVAAIIAQPMTLLSRLAAPFVNLLSLSTDLVVRLLGVKPSQDPPVTEEEIRLLIEQGTEAGVFEVAEQDIVEEVFRLGDRTVSDLMTPRPRIVWLDADSSPEEQWQVIAASDYSYFPLYRASRDNVMGIVSVKDIWTQAVRGQPIDLVALARPPLFVPATTPAFTLLELLRQSRQHLALVIDEYGGIIGLVTLLDVLEAIVGDLPASDEELAAYTQREDGSWLVDGMLPIDEFEELLDGLELPEDERGDYQTLGGFVLARLGRIPTAGDAFAWGSLRFEVMDMDGHRVDKVLVARSEKG